MDEDNRQDDLFAVDLISYFMISNSLSYTPFRMYSVNEVRLENPFNGDIQNAITILRKDLETEGRIIYATYFDIQSVEKKEFHKVGSTISKNLLEYGCNAKNLLDFCALIGNIAVEAYRKGNIYAPDYAILIICDTLEKLRLSGKFSNQSYNVLRQVANTISRNSDVHHPD